MGIFSGKPDPVFKVLSSQPNYQLINALLSATKTYSADAMRSRLGYKGLVLQNGKKVELIVGPESKKLQLLLLQIVPKGLLSDTVIKVIQDEINSDAVTADVSKVVVKRYNPTYNPAPWGGYNFRKKICNNCYDYATTKVTNEFAQPGIGSGHPFGDVVAEDVLASAQSDGLVPINPTPVHGTRFRNPTGNSHMVCLVVWPG